MGKITLSEPSVPENIQDLFRNTLVWDDHGCMPLRPTDDSFLPQLDRYKQAGVDLVALNVGFDAMPWERAILMLAHFRHWIRQHGERYQLIETLADIEEARSNNKLGVMFDLEGGCALNNQLSMVELYYDLGVRWMLFAYNRNNSLAGGCQDDDQGLTAFGRQVLDEMARVGMVTCCTHAGHRSTMEIIDRSENPVIFSHSNPRAIWDHDRNIRDEAIKACAARGGVIAINGIGDFLGDNTKPHEDIVRHIDHVAQLVGVNHVGLGLDYVFDSKELDDYIKEHPELFPPEKYQGGIKMVAPEHLPGIITALAGLGYKESDLKKIMGANHLRVASQVWK